MFSPLCLNPEPCQTSKMESFAKIVNGLKLHLRCLTGLLISL